MIGNRFEWQTGALGNRLRGHPLTVGSVVLHGILKGGW